MPSASGDEDGVVTTGKEARVGTLARIGSPVSRPSRAEASVRADTATGGVPRGGSGTRRSALFGYTAARRETEG